MTPLVTLTGNLLAERTLTYPAWMPGHTHRAARSSFQVGGKGINVAKMLERLGSSATAWCFIGGAPGEECREWLAAQPFAHHAFATTSATRTGVVIRDLSGVHRETTFLGADSAPDPAALAACAEALRGLPPHTMIALCGSFPGWSDPAAAPLRETLRARARQGSVFADTYGPPLADLANEPLALIKINADEFRALAAEAGFSPEAPVADTLAAFAALRPVRTWIVTDGPRALYLLTTAAGSAVTAFTPPTINEVSPTGCGDVLFAAWLHARHALGHDPVSATRFALPFAAANAAHPGIADFELAPLLATASAP